MNLGEIAEAVDDVTLGEKVVLAVLLFGTVMLMAAARWVWMGTDVEMVKKVQCENCEEMVAEDEIGFSHYCYDEDREGA